MSNNFISQPLSVEELQMDHSSNNMDSSMAIMQTGVPGNVMNITTSQHFELSNRHMLREPKLPIEPPVVVHSSGVQTFVSPNQQLGSMGHVMINTPSLPIKRSYNGEPLLSKMQHKVNIPGFQQPPPRKIVHGNAKITPSDTQNQSSQNKKMARIDSISSGRPGSKQVNVPRNRIMHQMESSSPRVKNASSETVRSKMRESLVAALHLVSLQKSKCLNKEKVSGNDATMITGEGQQLEQQLIEKSVLSDSVDSLPNTMDKSNDVCISTQGQGIVQTWRQGLHVGNENNTPFGDSFFAKDELLQGNGLTWAYDLPMDVETTTNETIREEREAQCPIVLANKIEAELFKFFGGVNKKYKEKGRSLLFNLKDPSNPELREKVISGEITPERLCSMSAEDLASEELSQWRIAKAEELAQMVVLPDSNVRRLVKKTHKGEFQVEVEDDHVVSAEVSIAPSSISRDDSGSSTADHKTSQDIISDKFTIPNDGTDLMQGLMVDDEFKDSDLPPIVSLDEFMESLDAEPPFENLPLDVKKTASPSSLSSPNIKKMASPTTDGAKEDSSSKSKTDENSNSNLKLKANNEAKLVTEEEQKKYENEDSSRSISYDGEKKQAAADSEEGKKHATKVNVVWEGSVQMSVSSVVTLIGYYKSGEKAVTKEWTRSLEIKGRVRLDAFEKFVQELPMSRSRAVMVAHFVLKDEQSEEDKATINEAVNSYVVDERLGFAEPETGVEVYFCPPHPRIKALIKKNLIRNLHDETATTIDSVNNGLIAVVVWRKVVVFSPNSSSSAHKHSSENHHFSRRQHVVVKQQQQDHILNSKYRPPNRSVVPTVNNVEVDDDDDVPPGFGPGQIPIREDDDLPEFNFTRGGGSQNMPLPTVNVINRGGGGPPIAPPPKMTRPVSQVRELILKYGQNPTNITSSGFQSWNDDDDDDDIPEWQPQSEASALPQTYPVRLPQTNEQTLLGRSTILGQQQQLLQPLGSEARWVRPPGPLHGQLSSGGVGGGYYGQLPPKVDRRPEAASRNNRGF